MPWLKKRPAAATTPIPLTDQWKTNVLSEVTAHRSGNVVTVTAWRLGVLDGVVPTGSTTTEVVAYSLPLGFRTVPLFVDITTDSRGAKVYLGGNTVTITSPSGAVSHHSFTFVTLDPMPVGGA